MPPSDGDERVKGIGEATSVARTQHSTCALAKPQANRCVDDARLDESHNVKDPDLARMEIER